MAKLLQMNTIRAASKTLTTIPTLCGDAEENHASGGGFRFLFDQDIDRIYRRAAAAGNLVEELQATERTSISVEAFLSQN
jgi:hypothetical protein